MGRRAGREEIGGAVDGQRAKRRHIFESPVPRCMQARCGLCGSTSKN